MTIELNSRQNLPVDVMVKDVRMEALCEWMKHETPYGACVPEVASTDASFRRYFRIHTNDGSFVVMDSPPELEPCKPFIDLAQALRKAGIKVPQIHFQNSEEGFLILSDFGDLHYQEALKSEQRNHLYELAVSEILNFQKLGSEVMEILPTFDPFWQKKELDIFREWCLPHISEQEYELLTQSLVEEIERIPKSFMHRDFHCRNLLVLADDTPGIIDFQGAMLGPITYDLVSLLRDCYVDNSEDWINDQVTEFRTNLIQAGLLEPSITLAGVKRWFDWSGLQRHLKCVGIFHRLKIRDGKPEYMKDVPRVLGYIKHVLQSYPELSDLRGLVESAKILTPNT